LNETLTFEAKRRRGTLFTGLGAALLAIASAVGCSSTTDSLGDTRERSIALGPVKGPLSYPNLFRDLLGKSQSDIDAKIDAAYEQLFHGDPNIEAILRLDGTDSAIIQDTFHLDQRTEGYGLAMLVAVQLNHRDDFDRIWRGAQRFRFTSGPSEGYFTSVCDGVNGTETCVDPYGMQQFVMALIFANDVWKNEPATVDYASAATHLLYSMQHKEDVNGGVVNGVTNAFDAKTKLVPHQPQQASANLTRPSLAMPAYYALWAQATGDDFYLGAAAAARSYLTAVAHNVTGLTPLRSDLSGTPVRDFDSFQPESYRVQLNLMLDRIWTGQSFPASSISERLLRFFASQGKDTYGRSFSLDGSQVLDLTHEPALIAANGMSAIAADAYGDRQSFVEAVWDQPLPIGTSRYYAGLLHMLALLALGGELQVR
jgi:oligosaccharide reducing-end xylanase